MEKEKKVFEWKGGDDVVRFESLYDRRARIANTFNCDNDVIRVPSSIERWEEKEWQRGRQGKPLKVKISSAGDIIEFMQNVVLHEDVSLGKIDVDTLMLTKGIQLMAYDRFLEEVSKRYDCTKEEVEKKYFLTIEELKEKMEKLPNKSLEYQYFFRKKLYPFSIWWYFDWQHNKESIVGEGKVYVWLAKGDVAVFAPDERECYAHNGKSEVKKLFRCGWFLLKK